MTLSEEPRALDHLHGDETRTLDDFIFNFHANTVADIEADSVALLRAGYGVNRTASELRARRERSQCLQIWASWAT